METTQPLSRSHRLLYMVLLFVIFLLVMPYLIIYALGYRVGFDEQQNISFTKTGGFYLHTELYDSSVYIDNEFFKKTGIFNRNVFVQDLFPGTYEVSVVKDEYNTWKKTVKIYPNLVTEVVSINFPEKFDFLEIQRFASTTATSTNKATTTKEYAAIDQYFTATTSATSTQKLSELKAWLDNGNVHVIWEGERAGLPFYFCDGETCVATTTVDKEEDIEDFAFVPGRDDSIIIDNQNGIFMTELDQRTAANIQPVVLIKDGKDIDFKVVDGRIYIKDSDKNIFEVKR